MLRTLLICGAAIGALSLTQAASAEPARSQATDFSAQKKKAAPRAAPARVSAPRVHTPRVNVNRNVNINRNVNVNRNVRFQQGGGGSKKFQNVGGPGGQQFKKLGGPGGPQGVKPQLIGGPVQKLGPLKAGPGKAGPAVFKQANFPVVKLGPNKVAPKWVGPKKLYWGGKWKTFVPLAALGAVVIGGSYYYADSYLTVAQPYCGGVTPDGCRLNWQRVNFEDGESEWQCVQYCARPGAPPPARTVALAAPPPPMRAGACELSIFSEPNYRGTNATSADEQPRLSELGWANQIASIKVASGTWDFFTEPDFTGEVVRFGPGEYPDLGPDWSRKAGSFMCVQP